VLSESEPDEVVALAYPTRRARRAAERLALSGDVAARPEVSASTSSLPEIADPSASGELESPAAVADLAFSAEDITPVPVAEDIAPAPAAEPVAPVPAGSAHAASARRTTRARRAPSRRRAFARGLYSTGAMAFAAALAIGMTLPSNVFGTAAPVVASELPAGMNQPVEGQQTLDVDDAIIAAEAPVERDAYESQSFADAERARYQASGQGFAPGFVPTAGAIRWPFDHSVPITSGFGYSDSYGGYHSGIDFIPGAGAPISAIADGVVLWVGWDGTGYGYYVKIQSQVDGHQIVAIYAHMIDNSAQMYPGQLIKVGDFVGLTGETGIAYGAHLHLGIQQDGTLIDPFPWLTEHATDTPAP